jgi:hypothetical protein
VAVVADGRRRFIVVSDGGFQQVDADTGNWASANWTRR